MRTIYFILYKEFRQIFRNRAMLPIIFIVPVVQLIVLAYAADFEVKDLKLFWIDKDQSQLSRQLLSKFEGSPYFRLVGAGMSRDEAEIAMEQDDADVVLEVPVGFERDFLAEKKASLQLTANAIDGVKGGFASAYGQAVIRQYYQDYLGENAARLGWAPPTGGSIRIASANWYNPEMDYKTYMVPGILALLVTMIGAFLSSMNIVREKELGTIEQLNVTPIKKVHFILGKLIPFWCIAIFELAFGLLIGKLLYDIPMLGNLFLLFGLASVYLLVVLGIGLFISTVTETQQQAMFISWFILVIFIFLSGLFTAIENMPLWAQQITYVNPVRYFIEILRSLLLKGSGWADLQQQFYILLGYAVAINSLAIWRYRKTN